MIDMQWMGDKVPNYGTRVRNSKTYTPIVIANHISAGTMGSMYNWFKNPSAEASSHFGVGRDGTIHQYVRIDKAAWTQGLTTETIKNAKAPIVLQMGVNPNLYCVSIEHEGYVEGHLTETGEVEVVNYGLDGSLTEKQFWTNCWLHKYIQHEVETTYGHHITFGTTYVLGHYQIDPIRKPNCPGQNFPWARLYAELAIAESMSFEEYEERVHYQMEGGDYAKAYAAAERSRDLGSKLSDVKWGTAAAAKLLYLTPILNLINYQGDVTPAGIAARILQIYETLTKGGQYASEALRKMIIVYNQMKTTGLL